MALTQDEWIASGLDNAELAEVTEENDLQESLSLLEKALFCLIQGKDSHLARKARTHRASLLLQQSLQESRDEFSSSDADTELRCADVIEQLLSENLLVEVCHLLEASVLPRVGPYLQSQLEKTVLLPLKGCCSGEPTTDITS